ncbi:TlpA family protein disulfide reductase [Sphingobacterium sp. SG20118]|uniref:TlpA family protein disulfide reductase n=1 Tax=Sphingobacterium TaxID=28453 RepID=UPI0004F8D065|nr:MULTISPECIES: TlpA disulfide reductase family protein [Sphingobacterium]AIM35525.1 protein-disulfide isomerase [Sphingobacterium sp. ML3W]MDH5828355.1 TlpA disulfide reductase family protein [Sphingobacterium faecium]
MKNILGLILSFLFFAAEAQTSDSGWKVQLNETAPTFVVPGKDSTLVSSADLKGKVVLLNFFATWCPPCREELPRLQKEVWDKYKDHPKFSLLVLAREQNWDKIDPFLAEHKFTLPIYPDLERNVFGLFADQGIPRNVIIDGEGKVIYQSIGYEAKEFDELIALLDSILLKD